jgi:fatty acid desaturase
MSSTAVAPPAPPLSHLTEAEITALGAELDRIRADVLASRGTRDARYIRAVIAAQRGLEVGGRALLFVSVLPPAWLAGTAMLSTAKILENMEIGHNVLHGQWDWMRDPAISSTTWEWDLVTPAAAWKHTHNDIHHTWTNVVGRDRDVGYTIIRMSPDQPWRPWHLAQPAYNILLAAAFEWGIALFDLELDRVVHGDKSRRELVADVRDMLGKATNQAAKDYLLFPLLAGPSALPCLLGNLTATVTRNVWAHTVIFCGHFPAGAEQFTEDQIEGETRGGWYLRQLLGSANISGGPLLHLLSGNLSHQIEHHLFPDLPSNRYVEIAPQVRRLCEQYGLPYTTGNLARQYASTWKRIFRYALPGRRNPAAAASSYGQGLQRSAA